ncbi:MAG: hypothetical protein AB1894_15765 [Chloroflexota bacterium]
MTTLTQLIAIVRAALGDDNELAPMFPDDQITTWINHALGEISQMFPDHSVMEWTTVAGQRRYEIEQFFFAMLSVEYPYAADADPPQYLKRRSYTHRKFWLEPGYYDIIQRSWTDETYVNELLISSTPLDDETIRAEITLPHNALADGGDVSTLPDVYNNLICLYCHWNAWKDTITYIGRHENPGLVDVSREVNATRAEKQFRNAMEEARKAQTESRSVQWQMDKWDQVY